jgi:hypothetical protein
LNVYQIKEEYVNKTDAKNYYKVSSSKKIEKYRKVNFDYYKKIIDKFFDNLQKEYH